MSELENESNSFINPGGIIELRAKGPSTSVAVNKNRIAVTRLAKQVQALHKPILILVDVEGIISHDEAARRAVVVALIMVPHDKIAFYGTEELRVVLNTLAIVADKDETVKAFGNRADSIEWLRKN